MKVVINAPLLHWRWVSQAERSQIVDAASWGSSTRGICGVLQPGAQLRIVVPEDLQVCGGPTTGKGTMATET